MCADYTQPVPKETESRCGARHPGRRSHSTGFDVGCRTLHRFSWYQRFQAWILVRFSRHHENAVERRKHALLGGLEGRILEIGPGTGVNLRFFTARASWVGLEPNPFLHGCIRREAERLRMAVEVKSGTAASLPAEDGSLDAVVATLVLCTVRDVPSAMREILRVLKPGGRFVFMEHVAAPRGSIRRFVQSGIRPLWALLSDGCRPDRETGRAIEQGGFSRVDLDCFQVPFPIVGPHIAGTAIK